MEKHNHILSNLTASDYALLQPHLVPVDLPLRMVLESPHQRVRDIYFLEAGLISVVVGAGPGQKAEAGIIGSDGVTGHSVIMGDGRSPVTMYMQIAGHGLRMPAEELLKQMGDSASLRKVLKAFMSAFLMQATYTILANSQARIDKRLARWLLMAHDRIEGDKIYITHEFLSIMLGVRRPGVTEALHKLSSHGFVTTERSSVRMIDRDAMTRFAGCFYGTSEAEQTRLTGWQSRPGVPQLS